MQVPAVLQQSGEKSEKKGRGCSLKHSLSQTPTEQEPFHFEISHWTRTFSKHHWTLHYRSLLKKSAGPSDCVFVYFLFAFALFSFLHFFVFHLRTIRLLDLIDQKVVDGVDVWEEIACFP